MEFRVLGPFEVCDEGGVVPIRAAKERALLVILLLHANEVVSSERLIDQLWGERPPDSAANVLQTYVSHLRRLLSAGARSGDRALIVTRSPGYVLRLEPGQLDRDRFETLVADARATDDPAAALAKLRDALRLWRGPPLEEFAFEEFAQREIARLEELRLATIEERIELELRLGRHADVAGELESLTAAHPLRERLRGQLMLALYRCGRQAEALQAYQDARRLLVDELGIDPSRQLRELEQAILRQDPALDVEAPVASAPPPPPVAHEAAAPEAAVPRARSEVRKTVTIVFSDVVESSRLSTRLDPEVFRRLMSRYFDEMRTVVERHGGIVEKYIGDAIMAVFGVPVLHEDDALRAVRAAAEMRARLLVLNDELEQLWGVRLGARIGVNTGEVVAGDHTQGHVFVTGDAVNVAKRLEEGAAAGEILIGRATHQLVRDAVVVELVADRALKHGLTLNASRLVEVRSDRPGRARRFDSPLVDRERQLETLRLAARNALDDRMCHLVTILGSAGVGKSRLVQEFVDTLEFDATVLRGRCLPYGEGITYWPLAEVVRDLARTEEDASEGSAATLADRLAGEDKGRLVAERVAEAVGIGRPAGKSEEIFWAVRKLFEALAQDRALVVVLDDIQWAEPTFLELVEHVADFSRDASILLVCMARPDLLDQRPGWGGGKLNATSIMLEPLSDDECKELIEHLAGGAALPQTVESRITEAAGGNALFAEELLAMLIDDELLTLDEGRWTSARDLSALRVPESINALLAARLESLPQNERTVVTAGSIEGTIFHRGAVTELIGAPVEASLLALVRKDIVRPERSGFAGEDAFRFRHVLICDAAYRSLPRSARADLHERYAEWLQRTAEGRTREYEEIVGYHLEQAFHHRAALESVDERARALALGAAARLESAGRRALARSDIPAAVSLLERASDLLAVDERGRARVLPELGAALIDAGRLPAAEAVLREAQQLAIRIGDDCAHSHALVQQQFLRLLRVEPDGTDEAARAVDRVLPVFERHADHHGLCRAQRLKAWLHWNEARAVAAAEAWERAATHARKAGDEDERSEILNWLASSVFFGPTPVAAGIHRCDSIRAEVSGNLASEAWTLRSLAGLHALDGRFELARELLSASRSIFAELGQTLNSSVSHVDGIVELLAGDPAAAEARLQAGYDALEQMGDRAFLSTTAGYLAHAVLAQGRDDDALRFAQVAEQIGAREDCLTQILWRSAHARVLAGRGQLQDAERLARDAVQVAMRTDFVNTQADALVHLAQILHDAGRADEANAVATEALDLYEQKGNVVSAERLRRRVAVLPEV